MAIKTTRSGAHVRAPVFLGARAALMSTQIAAQLVCPPCTVVVQFHQDFLAQVLLQPSPLMVLFSESL